MLNYINNYFLNFAVLHLVDIPFDDIRRYSDRLEYLKMKQNVLINLKYQRPPMKRSNENPDS